MNRRNFLASLLALIPGIGLLKSIKEKPTGSWYAQIMRKFKPVNPYAKAFILLRHDAQDGWKVCHTPKEAEGAAKGL